MRGIIPCFFSPCGLTRDTLGTHAGSHWYVTGPDGASQARCDMVYQRNAISILFDRANILAVGFILVKALKEFHVEITRYLLDMSAMGLARHIPRRTIIIGTGYT